MTNQATELRSFSIKQSAAIGARLGLKLAVGYAVVVSAWLGVATFNPVLFLITLVYALMIGLIPAVFIGTIAGMIFSVLFNWLGNNLSEWKIITSGWALGFLFALILPFLLAFAMFGIETPNLELIEVIKDLGFLLLFPSAITVFAIGWLARKIGGLK